MASRKNEDFSCFICDYWWLILLLLALILSIFFTRNLWGPLLFPPTATPVIEVTAPATLGHGDVQVTLRWDGANDLDLHVVDPLGEEIFYSHKEAASNGILDVDANKSCGARMDEPVENIYWPTGDAPTGQYRVFVKYFMQCGTSPEETAFKVEVNVDGNVSTFQKNALSAGQEVQVYTFDR